MGDLVSAGVVKPRKGAQLRSSGNKKSLRSTKVGVRIDGGEQDSVRELDDACSSPRTGVAH